MSFVRLLAEKIGEAVDLYGYETLTCAEAMVGTGSKSLILRVDVDFSPSLALCLANEFRRLGLRATFFWRLHSSTYAFKDVQSHIRTMRYLRFEIGLHHEAVVLSSLYNKPAAEIMIDDLNFLGGAIDSRVVGVSAHGTFFREWNNLDFWKDHAPADFGVYEAYDLMEKTRYVSDSTAPVWKVYKYGELQPDDHRAPWELMRDGVGPIYVLIHPCVYD